MVGSQDQQNGESGTEPSTLWFLNNYERQTSRTPSPHMARRKCTTDDAMEKHMTNWAIERKMQSRGSHPSTAQSLESLRGNQKKVSPQRTKENLLDLKKRQEQQLQKWSRSHSSKMRKRKGVKPTSHGGGDNFERLSLTKPCQKSSGHNWIKEHTLSPYYSAPSTPHTSQSLYRISEIPKRTRTRRSVSVLTRPSIQKIPKDRQNRSVNRTPPSRSTISTPRSAISRRAYQPPHPPNKSKRVVEPIQYKTTTVHPPCPPLRVSSRLTSSHTHLVRSPSTPNPRRQSSIASSRLSEPFIRSPTSRMSDHPRSVPPVESRYRNRTVLPGSSRISTYPKKPRIREVQRQPSVRPPQRQQGIRLVKGPPSSLHLGSTKSRIPRVTRRPEPVSKSKPRIPDRLTKKEPPKKHRSVNRTSTSLPQLKSTESSMKSKKPQPSRGSSRPAINKCNRRLTPDTPIVPRSHKYPPPVRLKRGESLTSARSPKLTPSVQRTSSSTFLKKSYSSTSQNKKTKSQTTVSIPTQTVAWKRSDPGRTRTVTTSVRRIKLCDAGTQTDTQDFQESVTTANVAKILMARHTYRAKSSHKPNPSGTLSTPRLEEIHDTPSPFYRVSCKRY